MDLEEVFEYHRVAQREINAIDDEITAVRRRLQELEDSKRSAESKLNQKWRVR